MRKLIKMKQVIYLIITVVIGINANSQIMSVEDYANYVDSGLSIPENITYIKDVNGLLNPFVGTWKGTSGNKTYEFKISKITTDDGEIREDILIVRHRISNSQEVVIENTFAASNNDVQLKGLNMMKNKAGYEILYSGDLTKCGQTGILTLSGDVNLGSLTFYFTTIADTYELDSLEELGCPPEISYPWPIETAFTVTKE
jgi:hypothetical protein